MNTTLTLKTELSKVLQCPPSQRVRTIIDSPYTRQILEQLSAQEAYLIVKESWGSDSQILLEYIPPETIGHFIDMDCWEKDSFNVESLIDWLLEISNASIDALENALEVLDLDMIILLFQSYLKVVQVVPTDEHIPDLLNAGYESFDDIYYFSFTQDNEKIQLLKDILSIIFTHHQNIYYGIMEGVMWELKSFMEESIFDRRTFRLMEMGYPPPEEAMSIYQRTKPENLLKTGIKKEKTPVIDKTKNFLPSLYMEHFLENKGLIVKALGQTNPESRERFIYEMIYLANKIIMADFRSLNDVDELKRSMDKASSIASLGLAIIMKENNSIADDVLANINAETLFSLGYNMVYNQQQRLKSLLKEVELSMIPESLDEYVEGLLKKRPQYKDEEFSTIEQLEQVTVCIDRIETMVVIMSGLGWNKEFKDLKETNTGSDLDMENIILTSAAINFLEKRSYFRPLLRSELLNFIQLTTHIGSSGHREFIPEVKNEFISFLSTFDESIDLSLIEDTAELIIKRFEGEISDIPDLAELDPRFITCFVVKIQQ
jgi:hypothetical protein